MEMNLQNILSIVSLIIIFISLFILLKVVKEAKSKTNSGTRIYEIYTFIETIIYKYIIAVEKEFKNLSGDEKFSIVRKSVQKEIGKEVDDEKIQMIYDSTKEIRESIKREEA